MRIYNYDPKTGEYLGDGLADESPLEPGVYLIPAHATSKLVPTLKPGEAAIFADDNWRVVADYRGRSVCALDADGYYAGPAALALDESPDARRLLADPPPAGLPRPKWSGSAWIDGRTPAEIEVDRVAQVKAALVASDESMPRPLEDLIDVLVTKSVIAAADLPAAVRARVETRKTLREQLKTTKG